VPVEARRIVQGQRTRLEELLVTGAAFAALTQPLARHPVDGVTVRADDLQRFRHRAS